MNPNIYPVRLDTVLELSNVMFEVMAGDYLTNKLEITITQNNNPYDLTGLIVEVAFAKPDKTVDVRDMNNGVVILDEVNGVVECLLASNTIAADGRVNAQLRILRGFEVLTTKEFVFTVRKPIVNDLSVKSANEYPILIKLLSDVDRLSKKVLNIDTQLKENENTRINAELDRVVEERNRELAEEGRVTAEDLRVVAEADRVRVEGLRVSAEEARELADADRETRTQQAEATVASYAASESARVDAEFDRVDAEILRQSQEAARVTAEGQRVLADSSRDSSETLRVEAEELRELAESLREEGEGSRVLAEQARERAEELRIKYEYVTQAEYDALPDSVKLDPVYMFEITDNNGNEPNELMATVEYITEVRDDVVAVRDDIVAKIEDANDISSILNDSDSGIMHRFSISKGELEGAIDTADTLKGNLDQSIVGATNIHNTLTDMETGTIIQATTLNATLEDSVASVGAVKAGLDGSIVEANNINYTLSSAATGAISRATVLKDVLNEQIEAGEILKGDLGQIVTEGANLNAELSDPISGAITKATTLSTVLERNLTDAGAAQIDLEEAIGRSDALFRNNDLDEQIAGIIPLDADLFAGKSPAHYEAAMQSAIQSAIRGAIDDVGAELTQHKLDYSEDKKPFHFNHVVQEYLNIDKFWESFKDGRIYTTEFYHHHVSPSPSGVKKDDNEGLVCEPSTNTVRGRNDYEKIGLFMSIDVNAYVDENGDYHVIAIDGDGRFKRDGTMGDVYVMSMAGYQKRYENGTVWGVAYSDTMHAGFEILDEAVKPDGIIRPFLLHAKYVAGRNKHENNNLASISGVYPEFVNMSHNGQITGFGKKGSQYSGKTSHDDYYVQLMMWLKYATTNSDTIMKGCQSYYLQYTNQVAEMGVKRVIITNSQANNLLVGSTVSIGDYGTGSINADRQSPQNYNKANRVNILSIEDLGNGNSAVYVDTPSTFDTTLTTTIATYPWNSGGCDNVLGQDGSPYNNQSGKEPFIINGIEMIVGGYEVLQNLIIHNNNVDNRIDVYVNYDCKTYATSPNANYNLVGQLVQTNNTWKYGSKMVIPQNHPSIILVTEAEASSTTGTGDGIYTNPPSAEGYRVWRSLGDLSRGAICGLRFLTASISLANSYWHILGRLSATGRSRRRS